MSSNNGKKPPIYWVTLVIMLVAFVGVAISADERRGATGDRGEQLEEIIASHASTKNDVDSTLCLEEIRSSIRADS